MLARKIRAYPLRDSTPLLNPGAAGVVDLNERHAVAEGVVLGGDNALGVHLPEGTAIDREVLGGNEHLPVVHQPAAGDHTVAQGTAPVEAEVGGAQRDVGLLLDERALVEQQSEALAGGELALPMLSVDPRLAAALQHLLPLAAAPVEDVTHRAVTHEAAPRRL